MPICNIFFIKKLLSRLKRLKMISYLKAMVIRSKFVVSRKRVSQEMHLWNIEVIVSSEGIVQVVLKSSRCIVVVTLFIQYRPFPVPSLSWWIGLNKQEMSTPPWPRLSPLVSRGPWMSFVAAIFMVHRLFCVWPFLFWYIDYQRGVNRGRPPPPAPLFPSSLLGQARAWRAQSFHLLPSLPFFKFFIHPSSSLHLLLPPLISHLLLTLPPY